MMTKERIAKVVHSAVRAYLPYQKDAPMKKWSALGAEDKKAWIALVTDISGGKAVAVQPLLNQVADDYVYQICHVLVMALAK